MPNPRLMKLDKIVKDAVKRFGGNHLLCAACGNDAMIVMEDRHRHPYVICRVCHQLGPIYNMRDCPDDKQ
jgi:hypothetical protein